MNQLIVSGRLGHDPSMKTTPAGKLVCEMSLAVDSEKRDEPPTWLRVIAWEKQAEFCERYLKKGRKVLVQGRLQVRQYTKKDGTPGHSVEIDGARVEFMDSNPEQGQAQQRPQAEDHDVSRPGGQLRQSTAGRAPAAAQPDYFDDDVGF